MTVVGIGTDICDVARIGQLIEKHGAPFLDRVFTAGEQAYCQKFRDSNISFAGRWAAKEAISKALGTGWSRGIAWTDLEVLNLPDGKPEVYLHGPALKIAAELGIEKVLISISHIDQTAVAFALAQGKSPAQNVSGVHEDHLKNG